MTAEEPRRSVRATKGQNKALDETPPPEPASKPTPKPSTKKTKKGKKDGEQAEDDGIRCACGVNWNDVDRKYIACDTCDAWQHQDCMGKQNVGKKEHYYCEVCRPEDHTELLEALQRGEDICKERREGKKRPTAKGRKSARASEIRPESAEEPVEKAETPKPEGGRGKRKFEEEAQTAEPEEEEPVTNHRRTSAAPGRTDKRRKSSAKAQVVEDSDAALPDIESLPKERQNVAKALTKDIQEHVQAKIQAGTFILPEGETADDLSKRLAQSVEHEMTSAREEPAEGLMPYSQQFRALHANFKKNPALIDGLLDDSLKPAQVAVMQSEDMASEELLRERQRLQEKVDKQSIMVREDDKPRVRRTHKGDEYVDENMAGTSDSVFTSQPVRRRESEVDKDMSGSPVKPESASPTAQSPPAGPASNGDALRRQSSQNFDINNVWDKTAASPLTETAGSRQFHPQNGTAEEQHKVENATEDAEIDRLLADDDGDDSYSPGDIKTGAEVIWRGKLIQPGSTTVTVSAKYVAGNDFSRFLDWSKFLPSQFEIEGRLERSKADDYLCGLRFSRRSDVTVLALTPYDDRAGFDEIFTYFLSKGRYAVGSKKHGCSEIVKDFYISPVEVGGSPPPHIDLLDHCTLKSPATERVLLATFVINKPAAWDEQPPTMEAAAPAPVNPRLSIPGPAASPINPSGPTFSPATSYVAGYMPTPTDQSAFPPYPPYGVPPPPYSAELPQQQQQHLPQQVLEILGPHAHCPVAQEILAATKGAVSATEARNMLAIFERDARARDDMGVFSQVLTG